MISHTYKCIFIHIPKCAGSSIERAIGHADNAPNIPDHRSIRMLEQPAITWPYLFSRDNLYQLALRVRHAASPNPNPINKLRLSKEQYASYFKFTFVRNPWTRAFSWYGACMRDTGLRRRHRLEISPSFKEFIRRYAGKGALRTQLSWLRDCHGKMPLDFIGRFENLDRDFGTICNRLRIPPTTLPHARKGSGDDYRQSYDEESRRIIADVYSEEIELFEYKF
jgi:hypothetical protein